MASGKNRPRRLAMTTAALISAAWPRNAKKHIASALDCSQRQAWRIAYTGHIPSKYRARLVRVIDAQIDKNKAQLEALLGELRREENRASNPYPNSAPALSNTASPARPVERPAPHEVLGGGKAR